MYMCRNSGSIYMKWLKMIITGGGICLSNMPFIFDFLLSLIVLKLLHVHYFLIWKRNNNNNFPFLSKKKEIMMIMREWQAVDLSTNIKENSLLRNVYVLGSAYVSFSFQSYVLRQLNDNNKPQNSNTSFIHSRMSQSENKYFCARFSFLWSG